MASECERYEQYEDGISKRVNQHPAKRRARNMKVQQEPKQT
jgi:hypothetical protein